MEYIDLTGEQRLYLQCILDFLRENCQWPTHHYLESFFFQAYPDACIEEIVKSLPPDLTNPADLFSSPLNKAMLTVPAIYYLQCNAPELEAFLQVVKLGVDIYQRSIAGDRQMSSDIVLQYNPTWRSTSLRKVGLLFEVEPALWTSFSTDDTHWSCKLTKHIRRFRAVNTIEEYIEKRDPSSKTISTISMVSALSMPSTSVNISAQYDIQIHPDIHAKCWSFYTHEDYDNAILNATKVIEVAVRKKSKLPAHIIGADLMAQAFKPDKPILNYSSIKAEQEGMMSLLCGIIQVYKNPQSHRFIGIQNKTECLGVLLICSNLLYAIEKVEFVG